MGFLHRVIEVTLCLTGWRTQCRPKTYWKDYIPHLGWEHLGILQEELESVARDKEVSVDILSLLPPGKVERKLMNEYFK